MVLHFLNNLLDPNNLTLDFSTQQKHLVAEGFTAAEAENITWLQNHRHYGKYIGIGSGLFTIYTCDQAIRRICAGYFPRALYQRHVGFLLNAGIVYANYLAWDYLFTSNRYSSNNKFTNFTILSNRVYQESREQFIQHFEPLNRKFTQIEVDQFLQRDEILTNKKGDRNWIYNPYVHGDNEEAWRNHVDFLYVQGKRASDDQKVQAKIREENNEKIYNGESIQYSPFKTTDYIDRTGLKHNLAQFFLFNRWQPIY